MIYNFTLTKQELAQAREQIYDNLPKNNWSLFSVLWFFIALFGILLFAFSPTILSRELSFLLNTTGNKATLIIGLLICCAIAVYFKIQSNRRSKTLNKLAINRSTKNKITLEITENHIICSTPDTPNWTITPHEINSVIDLNDFLVFLLNDNQILCIPNRIFRTTMDEEDFREQIKELVPFALA